MLPVPHIPTPCVLPLLFQHSGPSQIKGTIQLLVIVGHWWYQGSETGSGFGVENHPEIHSLTCHTAI